MSSLAWVDFDEAERQRAQRIMALFHERETRDELGLGSIRDSIADHLFPGTSTIQTRLRYFLFIPWIFRMLEGRDGTPQQLIMQARALEIRLSDALKAGGESRGIIGRDAGARLQRLPSSVYWAGLGAWGIRSFPGSIDGYFASLQSLPRQRQRQSLAEESFDGRSLGFWNPSLPPAPEGLVDQTSFTLTGEEAQFVIDRLVASQPNSLLTELARNTIAVECDFVWEHPNLANFPSKARRLVEHGRIFSLVMHGASLLYNLQLSELREHKVWIGDYQGRLEAWRASLDMPAIRTWSLDDFWSEVDHPIHNIRPGAKSFVTRWLELVVNSEKKPPWSKDAQRLVEDRERRLKGSQSRFANRAVRDRWTGASGIDRLSFRWRQAGGHLRDLADAE